MDLWQALYKKANNEVEEDYSQNLPYKIIDGIKVLPFGYLSDLNDELYGKSLQDLGVRRKRFKTDVPTGGVDYYGMSESRDAYVDLVIYLSKIPGLIIGFFDIEDPELDKYEYWDSGVVAMDKDYNLYVEDLNPEGRSFSLANLFPEGAILPMDDEEGTIEEIMREAVDEYLK